MPHNTLLNFEIQKYYSNEARFKCVYSINNLRKIKDGTKVINFKKYKSIEYHLIALAFYVNDDYVTYFDSFGVEHIPK